MSTQQRESTVLLANYQNTILFLAYYKKMSQVCKGTGKYWMMRITSETKPRTKMDDRLVIKGCARWPLFLWATCARWPQPPTLKKNPPRPGGYLEK